MFILETELKSVIEAIAAAERSRDQAGLDALLARKHGLCALLAALDPLS